MINTTTLDAGRDVAAERCYVTIWPRLTNEAHPRVTYTSDHRFFTSRVLAELNAHHESGPWPYYVATVEGGRLATIDMYGPEFPAARADLAVIECASQITVATWRPAPVAVAA